PIQSFDASGHPVRIAAEVPDFDVTPWVPNQHRKGMKSMGRAARFGVVASGMAVQDSGLDLQRFDPTRVGVVMGAGLVPVDLADLAPLLAQAVNEEGTFEPQQLGTRGRDALF